MLIVQKYGGTSLGDTRRLQAAARRIAGLAHQGARMVVVVSAQGDTTDTMIQKAVQVNRRGSSREMDAYLAAGEQMSAGLMAMAIGALGCSAVSLTGWQAGIRTDGAYGNARITGIETARILRELDAGNVVVAAGFQGIAENGDITTLGRGGSDTTAVALAAALEADACEIYSDVDGIYTADPRLLPEAKRLESIDYRDMLALSKAGSKVLHAKSVEIAMANSVEPVMLSSFAKSKGTRMCSLKDSLRPDYAGISGRRERGSITLAGKKADAAALSETVMLLSAAGIKLKGGSIGENCITVELEPEEYLPAMKLIHSHMLLR